MTPLLLLPGMMCDARMWGDLSSLGRPLCHALPTAHATMAELAAEILQTAPPTFALAGLSMGGILAMEILRQAPHRVTHLALLDTNPLPETPARQAARAAQIHRAQTDLAGVLRVEMKPNYLMPGPHKAAILDLCMDMALTLGPQVFARQSRALKTRPDQTATLSAFKGPALILMGEHDTLCPLDRHHLMHRLMPQSTLTIIPGAAHLPTLEQPDLTAKSLALWLKDAP